MRLALGDLRRIMRGLVEGKYRLTPPKSLAHLPQVDVEAESTADAADQAVDIYFQKYGERAVDPFTLDAEEIPDPSVPVPPRPGMTTGAPTPGAPFSRVQRRLLKKHPFGLVPGQVYHTERDIGVRQRSDDNPTKVGQLQGSERTSGGSIVDVIEPEEDLIYVGRHPSGGLEFERPDGTRIRMHPNHIDLPSGPTDWQRQRIDNLKNVLKRR